MTQKVKKREFMRYPSRYLGGRYDIIDGEGNVIAEVHPPKLLISINHQ